MTPNRNFFGEEVGRWEASVALSLKKWSSLRRGQWDVQVVKLCSSSAPHAIRHFLNEVRKRKSHDKWECTPLWMRGNVNWLSILSFRSMPNYNCNYSTIIIIIPTLLVLVPPLLNWLIAWDFVVHDSQFFKEQILDLPQLDNIVVTFFYWLGSVSRALRNNIC